MSYGMDLIQDIRAGRATPPSGIVALGLDGSHRWLTTIEPGRAVMRWPVDAGHLNLEGAVICSWIVAIADQAMFFASNTLCQEGESTRTTDLQLRCIHNITDGLVTVTATVRERVDDRLYCWCEFILDGGRLAAAVTATIDIVR